MKQNMGKRWMIFAMVLVLCAGAAWYFTNTAAQPEGNAVLAYFNENDVRFSI